MRALFVAASQAGVEGWIASLAATGAPVKHVSAWSGPGELGRRHTSAVNSDPFLLGPGVSLEAQLSQQLGSNASSDALLVVSVDPASQPLLPRAGVVLLLWQPQVPSQVLDQVQLALSAAPSMLSDGAAAVRGLLLVDASPSITLSVTHKVLEGAGLAALSRKPTVLASRASASPQAALQALQQLAEPLPAAPAPQPALPASAGGVVRIAVARDDAFGPAFHENLTLLSQAGAQLLFFSPLYDTTLPAGATCLYLSSGGALDPERWQQLAANRPLLAAVRAFADVGGMVLAEGGGLLYLSRTVELQEDDGGHHHRTHEMAGVLPFKTRLLPEPQSAPVQLSVLPGNPLLPPGARPRGYLFAEASLVLVEERQLQGLGLGLGGLGATPGKGAAGGNHLATTYEAVVVSGGKGGEREETAPAAEGYTVQNVLGSACLLYLPSEPGLAAHMLRRCACVDPAALAAGMATHLGCSMSAVSSSKMQLHAAALASKDCSRAGSRRQSIQDVSAWGAAFGSTTGGDRSATSTASGMGPGLLAHGHGHYPALIHSHQHHPSLPMQPAASGTTSPRVTGAPAMPHSNSSTSLSGNTWAPPGVRRSMCGPLALQAGLQHVQSQPEGTVTAAASQAAQTGGAWRPSHDSPYTAGPSNLARQQMLLQQQIATVTPAASVASMSPCSTSTAATSAFAPQPRADTPEPLVVAGGNSSALMDLDMPHPPASSCSDGNSSGGLACGLGATCGRCRSEQLPTVLERSGSFSAHPGLLVGASADGTKCGGGGAAAAIHHAASAGSLATAYASTPGYGGTELSAPSYGRMAGHSMDEWSGSGVSASGWPMHGHRHGSMPMLASMSNAGGAPTHAHSSGVVCCAPGATEALVAMGLGNRLAGIGSDCDHPPDVCASRRVVLAWVAPEEAPQGAAARGIRVIQPAGPAAAQGSGAGFLAAAAGGRAGRPSVDKSAQGARGSGGCGRVLLVDELSLRQEPPGVLVLPDPCELSNSERLQLEQALVETGLLQPGGAPGGACAVLHASCRSLVDVMDLMLELGAAAGEPDKASMLLERLQARMRRVAAAVAAATLAGGGANGVGAGGVVGQGGLGRLPGGVASSVALAAAAAAAAASSPAAGALPPFLPGGRPRRVLVLQSLLPMMEPGRWVPEMLAMAGASSCLALPGGDDVALSWQDVRERAAPDAIIILTSPGDGVGGVGGCCVVPSHHAHHHPGAAPHAGGAGAPHGHASCSGAGGASGSLKEQLAALAAQPGWWCLPAVRSSQVYLMQAAYCVRAGPRVVDGVELLARLLLPPGCFSSSRKVPPGAVMKLSLTPGQRCRATLLPTYFVAYNP